jgi:DNA end-binding protein Ku
MAQTRASVTSRGLWSGSISFGLVNVPVALFPAYRTVSAGLRMHTPDGVPVERRYWCPADERELERDELVRGYELEDGSFVVLTDDELEGLEPRKSRDIDLRRFVDVSALDPFHFERAYILVPSSDSTRAYRLLAEAMEESGKAGIATFVMRTREYLVAILARDGILRAETLRFHDEVRAPADVGVEEMGEPSGDALEAMKSSVAAITRADIDRAELRDTYLGRIEALARGKRRSGEDVVEVEEGSYESGGAHVLDLMAALKRGLGVKDNGDPRGRSDGGEAEDELSSLTREELYRRARQRDIPGRSKMTKRELVRALA